MNDKAVADPVAPAGDDIPSAAESAVQRAAAQAPTAPPVATPTPGADGVIDLDALGSANKIKLGGQVFTVDEATIEVNKEIVLQMPDVSGKDEDDMSPAEQSAALDSIYPQLAPLVRDEQGNPITRVHAEKYLTTTRLRVVRKLINPPESEGNSPA